MCPQWHDNSDSSDKTTGLGLFAARPALYIAFLVLILVGAYGYKLRTEGIFACPADGYPSDGYLAYCNATAYGDYDHGAFWFDLERETQQNAATADVLFLGSSRMQFAFSNEETRNWFAARNLRYYLLGFSNTETIQFFEPILATLASQAKVYIINVDRFFDDRVTPPMTAILRDKDIEDQYNKKKFWQYLHQPLCTVFPVLCGSQLTFFRFRENGNWLLRGSGGTETSGVSVGPSSNEEKWQHYAALAETFISALPVERQCIVLTITPYNATMLTEATAIASALGLELFFPAVEGLRTFDGSHLDPPSAERWSKAFFNVAGDRIQNCLEGTSATTTVGTMRSTSGR